MSREILFKAKKNNWRKLPKEEWWVKGYYAVIGKKHVIINQQSEDYYSVDDGISKGHGNEIIEIMPETVCRYTELVDKNKNQIFEGDCLGHELNVVEYMDGCFTINGDRRLSLFVKDSEIVGNIFDLKE